jgi:hypothetical protein
MSGEQYRLTWASSLYDSAINIHIISYLLTKKEKKGKNLFCFVCMILLLIYMCLCLVIERNCMYTWWVDCSMSYVNCFLIVPSCCWRGFVYRQSYWFINRIFEMKWNEDKFKVQCTKIFLISILHVHCNN